MARVLLVTGCVATLLLLAGRADARPRKSAALPADGLSALRAEAVADRARLLAESGPAGMLAAAPAAPAQPAESCAAAIGVAERITGIQPGLLGAIATVESGRPGADGRRRPWPWTVNVDGEGRFFPTRERAIAWVRSSLKDGATAVDVGCMQVDLQQHPHAFATLAEAFDPPLNASYAARFLHSLWAADAGHDWLVAAGFYHSHTAPLAASYRQRVAANESGGG